MADIRKKCRPEFFELVLSGKKNAEIRLADFSLRAGDMLILEEWDPKKKKYTGRKISRNVRSVVKVDVSKMHSMEEIKKNGFYLIELEGDKSRLHSSKEMV
ncbi:MAG: DUF3850 domain-containing protein [Candidatus Aenigmarchaeota archaeon]|nr:DUF3850 domain-containing protein [Candidatus Aenigmarchaeota archaeon]